MGTEKMKYLLRTDVLIYVMLIIIIIIMTAPGVSFLKKKV